MIPPSLPPAIAAALDARMQGLSQTDAAKRQFIMSQTYRSGGGSTTIRSETDALAYALARMPATYAAVAACLNAIVEIDPEFAPQTLLDCGAGPGTATWAATQIFVLDDVALLDSNPALRALARMLAEAIAQPLQYDLGDIAKTLPAASSADLVVASYVLNEIPEAERSRFADALWAQTQNILLVVEPGTPAGYRRILDLRARLIAQGGHVVAPCPHDDACPLQQPDWCHFVQRLPRSRAHMALKGAEVPYEDEKFSYVAMSRAQHAQRSSRVLAQPIVSKIEVTAKLCTVDGVAIATAPKRDKQAYQRLKRLDWGDMILTPDENAAE